MIDPSRFSGAVKFGATVVLLDEDTDEEKTFQIVGEQEADIEQGLLNLKSPLARALIGKEPGDSVEVPTPGGIRSYEISARCASSDCRAAVGDRLAAMPRFRRWAAAASLGWAVLVLAYGAGFLSVAGGLGGGMLFVGAMLFLMALVLPLLAVWLAAWLAEELERQREIAAALAEVAAPLAAALASTREALGQQTPATSPEAIHRVVQNAVIGSRPDYSVPLDRLLAGQARVEVALQKLTLRRPTTEPEPAVAELPAPPPPPPPPPAPPPAPTAEPPLPLMPEEEAPARPDWPDLVRALDFPRDAEDREGFRALKAALRHHSLAQTLQAAEDVLNLLSQEGVFVDELPVAPFDAGAWRRFMAGRRGPEVTGLGGDQRRARARCGARADALGPDLPRLGPLLPAPFRRRARRVRLPRRRPRARGARRHPLGPRLHDARPAERLARLGAMF